MRLIRNDTQKTIGNAIGKLNKTNHVQPLK